jgi:hypothetical protein
MKEILVIDRYKSFIWTDRYNEAGEFELCIAVTDKNASSIKKDMFVSIPTTNRMMVVESIKIESDSEEGNYYLITGRSIESILDRRIVWKQTNVYKQTSVQDALLSIINDAFVNPTDIRRRINNFVLLVSNDSEVTSKVYAREAQYMGDSIYDVVKKVCQAYHLGFKIEVNSNNEFEFSLYAGVDRSQSQSSESYVVFSPNNDNLLNSNYLESIKNYKNVLRIGGEGEGATQTFITHYVEFDNETSTEITGLKRREIYVDCHDVSSILDGNVVMDAGQYTNTLVQKGVEKMAELVPETAFEGEIDSTVMFEYMKDFKVGDICEIANEYGISDQVRITEVVQTWEPDGYTCIPTLESKSKEEFEEAAKEEESKIIRETIQTAINKEDDPKIKVVWKDAYGGSEEYRADYVDHSIVKFPTRLMVIVYLAETNEWKVTFIMDDVYVLDKNSGTTTHYSKMMTMIWSYDDIVNYEVTHTN